MQLPKIRWLAACLPAMFALAACGDDDGSAQCPTPSPCLAAGVSCDGNQLVQCNSDAEGCLVETRTDCAANGQVCADSSGGPSCTDGDPCAGLTTCAATGTSCDGDTLVTCAPDGNACLVETRTDCTTAGGTCDDTGATASCQGGNLPGQNLATLITEVAGQICETLFRCCPDDHLARYFADYAYNVHLQDEGYDELLPPQAPLAEGDCPALVAEMLTIVPLGPWVEAAQAGDVTFDPTASAACLTSLREAACGDEALEALYDSSCFAFSAPLGGTHQRAVFQRTKDVGEACVGLYDGSGGGVYGTCDPTRAWCCRPSQSDPNACVVRDRPVAGVCVAAGDVGDPCEFSMQAQSYCRTGLYCDFDLGECVAPEPENLTPLAEGQDCYDQGNYVDLGECQASWCDRFGSNQCEPLLGLGQTCAGAEQCQSGACLEVCIEGFCLQRP